MFEQFRDPFKGSTPYIDETDETDEIDEIDDGTGSDESEVPRVAFPGHRDTLALLHLKQHLAPVPPAVFSIPNELLQQMYRHLAPLDFHAARHTCKKWFLASLDKKLLQTMTRKAGCAQATNEDSQRLGVRNELRRLSMERRRSTEHAGREIRDCHNISTETSISDEWLVSKRLATEARITPGRHIEEASMAVRDEIDYRAILPQSMSNTSEVPSSRSFTTSSCGRFILVTSGQSVYIYTLWPTIRPLTVLYCHRHVLAVSMDTRSNRYSVAVLLEHRMGMCWDLPINSAEELDLPTFPARFETESFPRIVPEVMATHELGHGVLPNRRAEQFEVPANPVPCDTDTFPRIIPEIMATGEPDTESTNTPLDSSRGQTLYEQLGSPDDPPRSVAICPQRKCVAFGCRMGIELHWTDALTGGDLNRWFPLAAPSDYLYFLPQRPGFDSTKKLRLISSAGGPASTLSASQDRERQDSSMGKHACGSSARSTSPYPMPDAKRQSMTRLFFGSLPFPSATTSIVPSMWPTATSERQGVLRTVDCDHYRAIPLSDGVHVLFTDPASGLLCLGSDAPLGCPTKLIRKFVFLPPGYVSTTTKLLPVCYSTAQDLQWGVRVVASYADGSLVLFNVPSDCFNHVKKQARSTPDIWDEQAGVFAQSDLLMDVMMDIQRASEATATEDADAESHSQTHTHSRPLRTIQVPGVRIANLANGVDDIGVLCQDGGLRVWAFQSNGRAQCWDILSSPYESIRVRRVTSDGLIEEAGKGKARDVSKSVHVHFGGMDGSGDAHQQSHANQTLTSLDAQQIATSSIKHIHNHHRSFTFATSPHAFWREFFSDEELMSCLAYRRMVFENMGSGTGSLSTLVSESTRRKSQA